jgi:type II secretory pathway component PulF
MKTMNEKSKIRWLIGYLIILLLIYGAQSYYLYFEYIPNVLAPYATNDVLHAHIQRALYSLAADIRFWFVALAGSVTGLIIGIYVASKRKSKVGKK